MIQRKQSLFLLVAICAMAMCFTFPVVTVTSTSGWGAAVSGELNLIAKTNPYMMDQVANSEAVVMSQKGYVSLWPLTLLTIASALVALVALFMYKNRVRQMRVVAVGYLLAVIDFALIFVWAVDAYVAKVTEVLKCTDVNVHYGIGTWLPLVAVVLMFLAQRSIRKDEEKVRAADRLR